MKKKTFVIKRPGGDWPIEDYEWSHKTVKSTYMNEKIVVDINLICGFGHTFSSLSLSLPLPLRLPFLSLPPSLSPLRLVPSSTASRVSSKVVKVVDWRVLVHLTKLTQDLALVTVSLTTPLPLVTQTLILALWENMIWYGNQLVCRFVHSLYVFCLRVSSTGRECRYLWVVLAMVTTNPRGRGEGEACMHIVVN